ncbi:MULTISPECIES: DNA polymerase III subunit delta [unclassified Mycoplasma]|uniref:DNA polymerase III subunit delta n=1 Tax=unclassified Mycoplasma TaxID=2683645 RepID=UPI00211CF210|nr:MULTISPECIES: DNA polymerase III subunit delta [unclassified Mycoplasma]UUM20114.1 DNA polymerase III subunit delta [Mycoplasma sp. 1578d]UUM25094.1 DNA polymerase III subunit delta [Mycoplasma sp. 3686d]
MLLIYGEENFFIDQKIEQLKSKYKEQHVIFFNEKYQWNDIFNNLETSSLFSEPRLIIVENFQLFLTKNLNNEQKFVEEKIINLFDEEQINQLVFLFRKDKLPESKLLKAFEKNNKVIYCNKIDKKNLPRELTKYIKTRGAEISVSNLMYLIEKLPHNLSLIIQEINKLLLETKNITKETIDKSIGKYILDERFSFSNSFESKNFADIWKNYQQKKFEGNDEISLVSQIANIFILANKVYYLEKLQWDSSRIADFLKVHEFRIKKARAILNKYTKKEISSIIFELAKLDQIFKSTQVNTQIVFESFLIKYFSNKEIND